MYCVKYGELYLGWTLSETYDECEEKYREDPNSAWALATWSAKIIPVSVVIVEQGSITL